MLDNNFEAIGHTSTEMFGNIGYAVGREHENKRHGVGQQNIEEPVQDRTACDRVQDLGSGKAQTRATAGSGNNGRPEVPIDMGKHACHNLDSTIGSSVKLRMI